MQNTNLESQVIEPDVAAEEYLAVLLATDRDSRDQISETVPQEMFASPLARRIADAVYGLMAEQIEVDDVSLIDRLQELASKCKRSIEEGSSPEISLGLLRQHPVSSENAAHYIARVRENFDKQLLFNNLQRFKSELICKPDNYQLFRAKLEDEILKDRFLDPVKTVTIYETLQSIHEAKKSGGIGYSWGIDKRLDELTGGIVPGRYYAVGGLKKTGKSRFGLSVISELVGNLIAERRIPCLIVSLEMSADQVNRILLSRQANVDSRLLGTQYISALQLSQLDTAANIVDDWPLQVVDSPGMTIEQITSHIRRQSRKGVKVVLLDYLQRIDIPNKGDSRATAIQKAVNQLADAARKYNVALIALSQLANRAEFEDQPTVGDFKESGGIAEACDCAIILHNHDRTPGEKTHLFDIGIPVQRFGASGMKVTVKHDLRISRFYSIKTNLVESYCEKCGQSVPLQSGEAVS